MFNASFEHAEERTASHVLEILMLLGEGQCPFVHGLKISSPEVALSLPIRRQFPEAENKNNYFAFSSLDRLARVAGQLCVTMFEY